MKLSIKSIIRWEQITEKPFYSLNYDDKEDIITLLYVCSSLNMTLEDYKENISETEISRQIKEFEIQTIISSQFQKKATNTKKINSGQNSKDEDTPVFIKNIVPVLIMEGLDADFALNGMDVCDLPLFVEAFEKRRKETLEIQRMWTHLTISPHLTKKITPQKLCPFPWETEQIKADAIRNMEANKELSKKFFRGELIDIDKIKWGKR